MSEHVITPLHIEIARNSTDDFNLFHDPHRWHWLPENPFGGPIALGFQLACFIEDQVGSWRQANAQQLPEKLTDLCFSTYEFTFAGVVKAGDAINLKLKGAKFATTPRGQVYANRLIVQSGKRPVLIGSKKDSDYPLVEVGFEVPPTHALAFYDDRSFYQDQLFIKRKFMIVGNAKNFLCSAFVEQEKYIDEFADKVAFPETYPLSLISSALLERAQACDADLVKNPMIYTSHKLCIDKRKLARLGSNDRLTLLVSDNLSEANDSRATFHCAGLVEGQGKLFDAELRLAPLSTLTR